MPMKWAVATTAEHYKTGPYRMVQEIEADTELHAVQQAVGVHRQSVSPSTCARITPETVTALEAAQ